MKQNIVIVGLDYSSCLNLAKELVPILDMFFLDLEKLITYNLCNVEDAVKKVGKEYIDKQIKKIILSSTTYDNTIICCPYDLFLKDNTYLFFKENCLIINLAFSENQIENLSHLKPANEKMIVEQIAFDEFSKLLKDNSDICIKYVKNLKNLTQKVVNELISL